METPDEKWFRERLRHFLEIRHPPRQFHHVMIERRSRLAFESYAQSVELGVPAASAVRAADKVLFRGLLFSKYDTVHLILTTDFPAIPENQRQEIALRLVRICAPIFRAYDLKDDFSERPEFRQLKEELRTGIRSWIDENGVPAELIESERRIAIEKARESGKPENLVERIAEGSVKKFLKEVTLLNQPFVKDDKITVGQLLKSKGATCAAFYLFVVGEGIEKKSDDFAAEVAAQVAASKQA